MNSGVRRGFGGAEGVTTSSVALDGWHVVGTTGEPAFTNSWVNFGGALMTARFWKDPDGFVHLDGTIKSGTPPSVAFILPVGYRPTESHIFATSQNSTVGSVTIVEAGAVQINSSGIYASLNGISFPTTKEYDKWIPPKLHGTWVPDFSTNGATGATPGFWLRDDGLVWMKGGVRLGTANTALCDIPESCRPLLTHLLSTVANNAYSRVDALWGTLTEIVGGSTTWQALSGFWWWAAESEILPWQTLTLQHSWVDYGDPSWPTPSYYKDKYGMVNVRGLVKDGSTSFAMSIATLPVGYRPSSAIVTNQSCGGSGQTARVDINTTGDMVVGVVGTNGFLSLNTRFRAEG